MYINICNTENHDENIMVEKKKTDNMEVQTLKYESSILTIQDGQKSSGGRNSVSKDRGQKQCDLFKEQYSYSLLKI